MRVDFSHLQRSTLDQALPRLAERVYAGNMRMLIKTALPERAEYINSLLWTYDPNAWVPHGSDKDGFEERQPIFITSQEVNPNHATIIMLVDGGTVDEIRNYERCLNLFDGRDETAVQNARAFWKDVVAAGYDAYYWQQSESGKWEQKAARTSDSSSAAEK